MAEAIVFNLASKILSATASPAFKMVYEKGVSIWEAKDELPKLKVSVETIQAVLLDAEKKQEGSVAVKNWIKRVKGVLYDAEDLFDEAVTEDLVKQQLMDGKEKLSLRKKVHVSCSKLNPIVSRNSIAKKVKAIRVCLDDISRDMAQFQFVRCLDEKPVYKMGRGEDRGCFVDAKSVIGRDEDKKIMLKMLINESDSASSENPVVLAIVGIGGMGKTTLAQLIFNDAEIESNFEKRWFACISDVTDEREVLGKIFQSMRGQSYSELSVGQLQTEIRKFIKDKKYLLVLDDVWEDNHTRWQDRMSLLSSHATESRIIVTTRLPLVAKAVGALRSHILEGLSEDDSWSLFKRAAFAKEYENDPRRESLGKQILKKCSGVPLAIRSIGSLLHSRNTMAEWEAIARDDLPVLEKKYNDETMRVLKLSYDHLPSHLKHCFAYCCLFSKDYVFSKRGLINHWIAQGYIDSKDEDSGFMHLLRRGFFQEAREGGYGEIESCKMHDLMHDLAIYVAGEESVVLSSALSHTSSCVRHVSFEIPKSDEPWDASTLVLSAKSQRSLLLTRARWLCKIESSKLGQLFASVKLLRTLSLPNLRLEDIPPSIGELKLMRHLDLSHNEFVKLPHSIANLVNLLSLDLSECWKLKEWPLDFHKLISLRYLNIEGCAGLRLMPLGIEKMIHLEYLSDFKTEKGNECLHASARLMQQLKDKLLIQAYGEEDGDDCKWQLPVSLHQLEILGYRGMRIPGWGDYGRANNLANLKVSGCTNVKYLPSLRCLPNLRRLALRRLTELEFIEEEEDGSEFFPCLEELSMYDLPNLKRWWRKVAAGRLAEFPCLRRVFVQDCPSLDIESFPLCPHVRDLSLENAYRPDSANLCPTPEESIASNRTKWQLSLGSLVFLSIRGVYTLRSLQLASPHLHEVNVEYCDKLMSIEMVVPQHLKYITIRGCKLLKSIDLVEAETHTLSLGRLDISECWELESLRASAKLIASLDVIQIDHCPKLRLPTSPSALNHLGGCSWSVEAVGVADFGLIEQLSWLPIQDIHIDCCNMPKGFLVAPFTSLRRLVIQDGYEVETLQLDASPLLQEVFISDCHELTTAVLEAPVHVQISRCFGLQNLRIADRNSLQVFSVIECPNLETQSVVTHGTCVQPKELENRGIRIKRRSGEPVS